MVDDADLLIPRHLQPVNEVSALIEVLLDLGVGELQRPSRVQVDLLGLLSRLAFLSYDFRIVEISIDGSGINQLL